MPVDKNYTSLDAVKTTLTLDNETFADADLSIAIAAASRTIDAICSRRFWLDEDATQVRYYTPRRSRKLLDVDDLVTFTSLQTDNDGDGVFESTWTEDVDFVFEPLNAPADGEPYTMIRVRKRGHFGFPGLRTTILTDDIEPRSVKLTGQFGWATVPDEIVQATGILSSRLMRRSREAPFGVIGFALEQGAAVASLARNDPDVMMLVSNYVRSLMY